MSSIAHEKKRNSKVYIQRNFPSSFLQNSGVGGAGANQSLHWGENGVINWASGHFIMGPYTQKHTHTQITMTKKSTDFDFVTFFVIAQKMLCTQTHFDTKLFKMTHANLILLSTSATSSTLSIFSLLKKQLINQFLSEPHFFSFYHKYHFKNMQFLFIPILCK